LTAKKLQEELLRGEKVGGWARSRTAAATAHGTVPARRGDIGEDAGDMRFSSPYKKTRLRNFSTGGGSRDRRRQLRWRIATPTDRRIVTPQLYIPDTRTPNAKSRSRRGEAEEDGEARERCKGMDQPQWLQGKITSMFAAETLQGRMRSARGRFLHAVSFIT